MSEAFMESPESEHDEGEVSSEWETEAEAIEGLSEDARSDASQRARQREIIRARQRQAQLGRRPPSPPPASRAARPPSAAAPASRQTIRAINALDLENKVAQDSLRRAIDDANRRANRATLVAFGELAADQLFDTFETPLANHPLVRAGARWAPFLIFPAYKGKKGFEAFVTHPAVYSFATVGAIYLAGRISNASQNVRHITIYDPSPIAPSSKGNLTGYATDGSGNVLADATANIQWSSSNSSILNVSTGGSYTAGTTAGPVLIKAQTGGTTHAIFVTVSSSGGPSGSGLTSSGTTSSGPTTSGPTSSGTTSSGTTTSGPTSSGTTSSGTTTSGPTSSGTTSSGTTSSGTTSSGTSRTAATRRSGSSGGASSGEASGTGADQTVAEEVVEIKESTRRR
jgi:hypothetical protein